MFRDAFSGVWAPAGAAIALGLGSCQDGSLPILTPCTSSSTCWRAGTGERWGGSGLVAGFPLICECFEPAELNCTCRSHVGSFSTACVWSDINPWPPLTWWQKRCWVLLPSVAAGEGRQWKEVAVCWPRLLSPVYCHWIPSGNADSFMHHLGSSCSQAGTGQRLIVRSCRATLPASAFDMMCFLVFSIYLMFLNIMKLYWVPETFGVLEGKYTHSWLLWGRTWSSYQLSRLANPTLAFALPPLPLEFP